MRFSTIATALLVAGAAAKPHRRRDVCPAKPPKNNQQNGGVAPSVVFSSASSAAAFTNAEVAPTAGATTGHPVVPVNPNPNPYPSAPAVSSRLPVGGNGTYPIPSKAPGGDAPGRVPSGLPVGGASAPYAVPDEVSSALPGAPTAPSGAPGGALSALPGVPGDVSSGLPVVPTASAPGTNGTLPSVVPSAVPSATPTGGAPIQGPGVPIGSIITSCTVPGTFALTYDDGPFDFTSHILDLLDQTDIKATFFVNGNNVGNINTYAAVIQRMDQEGHQICSHTYSHADLATLGDSDVISEMIRLETDLINILGKYATYMRPPFFSTNEATLATLGQLGYHVVQADIDTLDFANKNMGNLTGATNFQAGINAGGTIALAHDIHQNTAEVLTPEFIRSIAASGLRGVTVGDCLGDPVANWYNATRTFTPTGTVLASTISITSTSTPTGVLSTDSSCGGPSNFVCPAGTCCSQFGFCGTSPQHCGTDCQPTFGVCGVFVPVDPNAPVPSTAPVATGGVSPDDTCGGANAFTCPEGTCCSEFGFCGTTTAHCSTGCQSAFGTCGEGASPAETGAPAPVATPGSISPDSSCGGANAFVCPAGTCCSQFGFCGTTTDHCTTGCQAAFGVCN
ncbi:hypothetical protein ACHAQH_006134 [Verticillium albo-atrum]